jgi:hypothetical protein
MLPKVSIIGDSFRMSDRVRKQITPLLTLLSRQKSQFVGSARVERVAFSVIPIFKDDTEAVELFHQNLDDYNQIF